MNTSVELENISESANLPVDNSPEHTRPKTTITALIAILQTNWALLVLGLFSIGVLITILIRFLYSNLTWFQAVTLLACISFFPLTYLAYQLRSEKHKARLVIDFQLLGFVTNEREREIVEKQYQNIHSPQQYIIYVSLASLVTLLGFGLLYFNPNLLAGYMDPKPEMVAMTMFYSFLGAFVFSIYNIFRRFVTYDLQPSVYLYVVVMMLTVMIIGFVLAQFLDTNFKTQVIIPLVAFTIGYLPDMGIRWIISIASRVVGRISFKESSLGSINGISLWHETRLRESGIDNTQNLESCDVRELLLSSRFSAQQLMNWIDQAILVTNVTTQVLRELNKHGIHTITTFRSIVDSKGYDALPELPAEVLFKAANKIQRQVSRDNSQTALAASAGSSEGARDEQQEAISSKANNGRSERAYRKNQRTLYQAIYCAAETSPNYYYVNEYWKAVRLFRTRQVRMSTNIVLQARGIQIINSVLIDPDLLEKMGRAWNSLGLPADILPTLFPDTPEGQVALGNLYIQLECYEDAIRTLTEVIREYPEDSSAYASRGLAHARLRHYSDAFADFATAKELSPNNAVTYHHMGAAMMMREQYRGAIAELNNAVKKDPSSAATFFNLGRARSHLNDFEGALEAFTQSINIKPYASAYFERGMIYAQNGRLMQAIDDFTKAIELEHGNAMAYASRGFTYVVLGDYSRARYDLDTAILYNPDLAIAYANRGLLNFQFGDEESAIDDYTEALTLNPNLADAIRNRGIAYKKMGEFEKAIEDFNRYSELARPAADVNEVQKMLAQLEKQQGK